MANHRSTRSRSLTSSFRCDDATRPAASGARLVPRSTRCVRDSRTADRSRSLAVGPVAEHDTSNHQPRPPTTCDAERDHGSTRPGHNGAGAWHRAEINRRVPTGRGGTKACNTTGTSTDGGYPEHAFNWDVALRVRDALHYIGSDGLHARADLAGLNLAQIPAALVECANMRNPEEAALVSTPGGRARYATAIANGIMAWLTSR